jgi:serine/threonine protein kinase
MAAALTAGTRIGHYEVVRLLGEGAQGAVYEARDSSGMRVAIKILLTMRGSAAVRFAGEAKKLAQIRDRHVVQMFTYVDEAHGGPYLVMEYLRGKNLREYVGSRASKNRALSIEEAVGIGAAVCRGTMAVHKVGVVHRDLKPGNVFLAEVEGEEGPQVKVLDFGIAKDPEGLDLTLEGAKIGTAGWMAPEQLDGEATRLSDQYAIGAILYLALTGQSPFPPNTTLPGGRAREEDINRRVAAGQFLSPRKIRPDVPEELERIVLRAMALQKEERFPDVRAFGVALGPYAGTQWTKFFTSPPIRAHVASEEHPVLRAGTSERVVSETIDRRSIASVPATAARREGRKVVVKAPRWRRKIIGAGMALSGLSLALAGLFLWEPNPERVRAEEPLHESVAVEGDTVMPGIPSLVSEETKHLPLGPPPGAVDSRVAEPPVVESVPSKPDETSAALTPRLDEPAATERSPADRKKSKKLNQRFREKRGSAGSAERPERTVFGGFLLPPTP